VRAQDSSTETQAVEQQAEATSLLTTGAVHQTKVARHAETIAANSANYKTVLSLTMTIPSGHGKDALLATFSAVSRCSSGNADLTCQVRILANGVEMQPAGLTFFDVDTAFDDGEEAHSLQRSACKGPGTYTIEVQTQSLTMWDLGQMSLRLDRQHGCSVS
jgi:hypothetical protein